MEENNFDGFIWRPSAWDREMATDFAKIVKTQNAKGQKSQQEEAKNK